MPSNFNRIYDPRFIDAAKAHLIESRPGSIADALALLSAFARECKEDPLPDGLVADLWSLCEPSCVRHTRHQVTPPLVLVGVTTERGHLARLKMEWIEGDGCSGDFYPDRFMAGCMDADEKRRGIRTDDTWKGAFNSAREHAKANGFVIPMHADVRWRVELVDEDDARACGSICKAVRKPWKPGVSLRGRSAGAAFLIGLVYLGQRARERTPINAAMQTTVNSLLPLLVLPELPERGTIRELGVAERSKIDALRHHLANLKLVFPESHDVDVPPHAWGVPDVAALVTLVLKQIKSEVVPDTIPPDLRAGHYVDAGKVGALMDSLCQPGVVVVHGPAGIGKTAFVIEAVRSLAQEGRDPFHDGRFYIDLNTSMPLVIDPPFFGESAPPFEDFPRHSASWVTDRVLDSLQGAMLKDIVSGLDGVPSEDLPKLKTQARDLLAKRRVLAVLEGAENVPEAYIGEFLKPLGGNTHIAWLTRCKPNPGVQGLDGRPTHEVGPLSLKDSRELLCHHGGLDPTTLDDAASAGLDSIAHHAEFITQFLVWAGRAIGHNNPATPTQIAKEIQQIARETQADPLTEFANSDRRDNARRFLESSLTRIQPALAATARRLFATLSAFHPAHGAPEDLWALAAELDTAQRTQQREFIAARRELLSLRLAVLDEKQNAYPVHSLAAALATALWHEQHVETRTTVLNSLARAAVQYLAVPPPLDWPPNAQWTATTTALAQHSKHWIVAAGFNPASEIGGQLTEAWAHLMRHFKEAACEMRLYPCGLLESVGSAVCAHFAVFARQYPKNKNYLLLLEEAWQDVGSNRQGWQDFIGAGHAYGEALKIGEALAEEYPKEPEYQYRLSNLWLGIADTCRGRRDWHGTEQALAKGLPIAKALVRAYPKQKDYRSDLADNLICLAEARRSQQDWAGVAQAHEEALVILEALTQECPKEPMYKFQLYNLWLTQRKACVMRQDWTGAKEVLAKVLTTSEALVKEFPEVPFFKSIFAEAQGEMGDFAEFVENCPESVVRLQRACETLERQVAASPGGMFVETLLIERRLSLALALAQAGQTDLARTTAEVGIAGGTALRAAMEALGLEQSVILDRYPAWLQSLLHRIASMPEGFKQRRITLQPPGK